MGFFQKFLMVNDWLHAKKSDQKKDITYETFYRHFCKIPKLINSLLKEINKLSLLGNA